MTGLVGQSAATSGLQSMDRSSAAWKRIVSSAVVLCSMLLFMLAKNIATFGGVTVDRFGYWIVALIPFVAYHGLDRLIPSDRSPSLAAMGGAAWIASLIAYLVLQLSFVSETFVFPVQDLFGYGTVVSWVVIAGIYAAIGSAFAIPLSLMRERRALNAGTLPGVALVVALNWIFFQILVLTL